jgi:uncharacterized protein (DUF427 family)
MSVRALDALRQGFPEGLHEPIQKRVRASLGGKAVIDSTRAMVVWEPRRVVPSYAVPVEDVRAEVVPAAPAEAGAGAPPVLHPDIPFAVHTLEGRPVAIRAGGAEGQGFRPADDALAGYVILDFPSFEDWLEEDDPVRGHARDPFHRIDVLPSSRTVRVELGDRVLAESSEPLLLFETSLPVRAYFRREDVRMELLRPSPTRSRCAYKGEAIYFSVEGAGPEGEDVAWCYEDPLPEVGLIVGRLAFFDERVDVLLDGVRRERPVTAWSRGS